MTASAIRKYIPNADVSDWHIGAVAAFTTRGTGNAGLTVTAKNAGTGGNSIRYAHSVPAGANVPLSVTVSGNDITVNVATGATAGTPISTALLVRNAINAHQAASALVTASLPGGSDGSGVVATSAIAALTGGVVGSTKIGDIIQPRPYLLEADYLNNLAIFGERQGTNTPLVAIIYNAMNSEDFGLSLEGDENRSAVEMSFMASYGAQTFNAALGRFDVPLKIYSPTSAAAAV